MSSFFQKIQEIGTFKKVTIYAASAWAIIQVIDYFAHRYQWPESLVDLSVVVLIAAIPFLAIRLIFQALGKYRGMEILLLSANVLVAGFFMYHFLTKPERKTKADLSLVENPTILVTPYQSQNDEKDSYFTDGVTSSIITELTKIGQLSVLSEAVTFKYKKKPVDVSQLAGAGINYLLQGKVQRIGNTVRVSSQLINLANNVQVWAGQLEGELTDIFKLQDKISQNIANALKVKLSASEEQRMGSNITSNIEAYDLYLKGKYRINSVRQEDIDSAIHYFSEAIGLDNNFAKAHAELSLAYTKRNHFITDTKVNYIENAYIEGEKALALDSTLAEVYYARAYESWTPQNKFPHDQVIKELGKALAINPKYADVLNLLAKVYMHVGLLDKGRESLLRATKANPLHAYALADFSSYYFFKGDYPNMLLAFTKVPKKYAEDPYWATEYYLALWNTGKRVEASKLLSEAMKKNPDDLLYKVINVIFLAEKGDKIQAQKLLAELENFPNKESQALSFHHVTYFMSVAYAILGNSTKAIEWLKWTAVNGFPSYTFFNSDPHLTGLKSDKRFNDLLEELHQQTNRYDQLVVP
jgi:TolB-like protein